MEGWILLLLTLAVVAVLALALWSRPGPDAGDTTRRPASERGGDHADGLPPSPGAGRPAGPGAEAEHVVGEGKITPSP